MGLWNRTARPAHFLSTSINGIASRAQWKATIQCDDSYEGRFSRDTVG